MDVLEHDDDEGAAEALMYFDQEHMPQSADDWKRVYVRVAEQRDLARRQLEGAVDAGWTLNDAIIDLLRSSPGRDVAPASLWEAVEAFQAVAPERAPYNAAFPRLQPRNGGSRHKDGSAPFARDNKSTGENR